MDPDVLTKLTDRLDEHGVAYDVMHHDPVYTSEQAAEIRGTPLMSGAKALICKAGDQFTMFVMPAGLKLFTRGVRKTLGVQRLRFATADELLTLTGLTPGCVPPFGSLFGLPTYCDRRLAERDRINFSAGDHTVSMGIAFTDYNRVESPTLGEIAK